MGCTGSKEKPQKRKSTDKREDRGVETRDLKDDADVDVDVKADDNLPQQQQPPGSPEPAAPRSSQHTTRPMFPKSTDSQQKRISFSLGSDEVVSGIGSLDTLRKSLHELPPVIGVEEVDDLQSFHLGELSPIPPDSDPNQPKSRAIKTTRSIDEASIVRPQPQQPQQLQPPQPTPIDEFATPNSPASYLHYPIEDVSPVDLGDGVGGGGDVLPIPKMATTTSTASTGNIPYSNKRPKSSTLTESTSSLTELYQESALNHRRNMESGEASNDDVASNDGPTNNNNDNGGGDDDHGSADTPSELRSVTDSKVVVDVDGDAIGTSTTTPINKDNVINDNVNDNDETSSYSHLDLNANFAQEMLEIMNQHDKDEQLRESTDDLGLGGGGGDGGCGNGDGPGGNQKPTGSLFTPQQTSQGLKTSPHFTPMPRFDPVGSQSTSSNMGPSQSNNLDILAAEVNNHNGDDDHIKPLPIINGVDRPLPRTHVHPINLDSCKQTENFVSNSLLLAAELEIKGSAASGTLSNLADHHFDDQFDEVIDVVPPPGTTPQSSLSRRRVG